MNQESNINRQIYSEKYLPFQLEPDPQNPYDESLIAIRHQLVSKFGRGVKALDVACGTGAYLFPHLDEFEQGVGIDFSRPLLAYAAAKGDIDLVEGDARSLPFVSASFGLAFSYTALYYMPDLPRVLREMDRVVESGGYLILEMGNLFSLNTILSTLAHHRSGWAKSHHVSVRSMRSLIRRSGWQVVSWRSFQLMPMYGATWKLLPLVPFLWSGWKRLLARRFRDRMLDEWISGAPLLRNLAFRHLIVVRKP